MEPEEKQKRETQAPDKDSGGDHVSVARETNTDRGDTKPEDEDLGVREFDDDDLTGDELDDGDLNGDELDDGDLGGDNMVADDNSGSISSAGPAAAKGAEDASGGAGSQSPGTGAAQASGSGAKRTGSLKKIVLASVLVILLSVAGVVLSMFWPASPEIELETAAVPATEPVEIVPVNMDAFLIPFSHGNFSYISLNVSIEVPTGRMRNEIIAKKDLIRGRIYDFLLVYAQDLANTPVPNDIKTIISKSINGLLSNGSVHELYLTQFIVI